MLREIRAAERQISRQKTRKCGGWKCETEGEEEVMEVRKERMENRLKYLPFCLPLIKLSTLSVKEMSERD